MSNQITPNPSVPSQIVAEVKFPRWINNLGIIPTSYKDSMSYYECLAWLCKFLEETVIPSVNENGEAVQELQNLYVELNNYVTHYFDTLDVQEEINNKLDQMVEDGTLPEIVADYLQTKAVFGFDTVADLKAATNLINGSYARTFGFYAVNDGGSAFYKIRTITNDDVVDNMFIIKMNDEQNQLIAELIIIDDINLKSIGLKENDQQFDNNKIIENAVSKLSEGQTLYIPEGNYYFSETINFLKYPRYANFVCDGNIIYTGQNSAIEVSSDYSTFKIKKISSEYNSYSNLPAGLENVAIKILSSGNSNYIIDLISGYYKGVEVIGHSTGDSYYYGGALYNTINVEKINAYKGCYITKDGGYVNENIFNIHWIDAYNGIEFSNNSTYSDYFNNNKFYDIGLENIGNVGIIFNGCRSSLIDSVRFENAESYFISEDSTSSFNVFIFNYRIALSKLDLNGTRSIKIGNVAGSNGDLVSQFSMVGNTSTNKINIAPEYNADLPNGTIFFENFNEHFCRVKTPSGTLKNVDFVDYTSNGILRAVNEDKTITRQIKYVFAATSSATVKLTTTAECQQAGYSFLVGCQYHTNALQIAKASGNVVISDLITAGTGTYLVMYANDIWKAMKLTDNVISVSA